MARIAHLVVPIWKKKACLLTFVSFLNAPANHSGNLVKLVHHKLLELASSEALPSLPVKRVFLPIFSAGLHAAGCTGEVGLGYPLLPPEGLTLLLP